MFREYLKRIFPNKFDHSAALKKGERGEGLACRFLKKRKIKVITKNFRSRFGEIDIVADDSGTLSFVEVKSRSSTSFGLPEEFVDKRKQHKIIKTALIYIEKNNELSRNM